VDRCPVPLEELRIKQACDPAAGGAGGVQRRTLDYTGIGVGGKDCQGNVWVLKAVERKIGPVELAKELLADHKEWKSEAICIEEVGFQSYIEPIIQQTAIELGEAVWFDRVHQSTRNSKNHRIISRLVPLFAAGRIKIMRDQTELISELTRFDGSRLNNKDNLLDMLEMLVRKLDPAEAKTKTLKDYTDADIAAVVAETRRKEELDIFPEQGPAEFDDVFLEAM
jgi:predicted phage terminase large subunit-like protein